MNLVLASSDGNIVNVEALPTDLSVRHPTNNILTHANHFETERFKNGDLIGMISPDS